jgi:hypothetical protein
MLSLRFQLGWYQMQYNPKTEWDILSIIISCLEEKKGSFQFWSHTKEKNES